MKRKKTADNEKEKKTIDKEKKRTKNPLTKRRKRKTHTDKGVEEKTLPTNRGEKTTY